MEPVSRSPNRLWNVELNGCTSRPAASTPAASAIQAASGNRGGQRAGLPPESQVTRRAVDDRFGEQQLERRQRRSQHHQRQETEHQPGTSAPGEPYRQTSKPAALADALPEDAKASIGHTAPFGSRWYCH